MKDMDTEQYKVRLVAMREEVTKELEAIATHNADTDDWEVRTEHTSEADPNVLADEAEDATERLGTLSALETRYRNIVRALEKIEGGTFGICEISGEEIEPERLQANPAARTCSDHFNEENNLPL